MPIEVRGAEQFDELAARIRRRLASNSLVMGIRDGLVAEAPEMRNAVFRSMNAYLPDRYAGVLRPTLTITPAATVAGTRATVRMTAWSQGDHIGIVNAGRLRHPVFGMDVWVDQRVRPGFITEPMRGRIPQLRDRVRQATRQFLRDMTRG